MLAKANPAVSQDSLAAALCTLERTLVVRSDTPQIMEYLRGAYRRAIVQIPRGLDDRTDTGAILADNGDEWLRFNNEPVGYPEKKPETHFRLAFYGASKLIRLSFKRNSAWHSLYAAALRIADRAFLISAQSGIGKTTLALELLSRSARLYSDEFAFIRKADRFVSGLPRALLIRERTLAIFPHARLRDVCEASSPRTQHGDRVWDNIDAGDVFGDEIFAEPAPLAATFMLERGEGDPRIEHVSPALAAVDFTKRINADAAGFERFADTTEMLAGIPCYRIRAALPADAAACIERLLR